MPTILGAALKINADASGVPAALSPVEKALKQLDDEAAKVTGAFDRFAKSSGAAADVQSRFQAEITAITEALKDKDLTGKNFADAFAAIKASADALADTFAEGAAVTERYRTEEDKRGETLQKLSRLLEAGAISEETYIRARDDASGANKEAAKSEKERADALAAASRIIQQNLTPQEKYDRQIQELRGHLEAGRLSQEQFNRAAAAAKTDLDKVGKAAGDTDKKLDSLNKKVGYLAAIEIGRVLVDGFQLLSNACTSAASQVSSLVTSVNSSLDALVDLSARTGINAEALQSYGLAAKLAGVDTEQFGNAVQKLGVNIGKANPGDAFDKNLKQIGLSVAELRTLAPEQQFSLIGQAISQLPSAAARAGAAVQIFGKQGAALAPLFRQGADSIDDLRKRADRLGAIVSEVQINNVAEMNDAFDLVSATVKGIVGQVIGNLAPAVSDVAEQFLNFVETFNGVEGTGGTGIANRITDVLLSGAEYLAGVFDMFVEQANGFGLKFSDTVAVFSTAANIFTAVTESLRAGFNLFQGAGNAIAEALGKVLEGLGSYLSSDLEAYGQELQRQAKAAADVNARELSSAAKNVSDAVSGIFSGESGTPQRAGAGAARAYVRGLQEQIAQERLPEVKVAANIDNVRKQLDDYFKTAGDGADELLLASKETLSVFEAQVKQGGLLPQQIQIMNGFVDQLNEKLQYEARLRADAADAAEKQIEADQKRVQELLKPSDAAAKLEEDLAAVYREQTRAQEQLAAARTAAADAQTETARKIAQSEADSAAASISRLDQIEAKVKETQQAAKQGFTDGFTKQFEETAKSLETARLKATDFGKAGLAAYESLNRGAAELAERARVPGGLSKAEYDKELARLQGFFEESLKREQENQRLAAESKQAANVRVDEFLKAQGDARTQREIAQQEEVTKRKRQALENIAAIQERIDLAEKAVAAARGAEDFKSAKARQAELTTLRKTLVEQKKVANENNNTQSQFGQQFVSGIESAQQSFANSFQQGVQNSTNAANFALQASAEAFAKQAQKVEQLLTPTDKLANTADVRTAEGQKLLLEVASTGVDPALAEARIQSKSLALIADGITKAASNYFNSPVAIVGAAALG